MIQAPDSLVENVITLLAYDTDRGKLVANLVEPGLFTGEYKLIATRLLEYWRVHKRAPGHAHVTDIFEDILAKGNDQAEAIRFNLSQMHTLSSAINGGYVITQLSNFIRLQNMKIEVLKAAEVLQRGGVTTLDEAEAILSKLVNTRKIAFDLGVSLDDVDKAMTYLQNVEEDGLRLGIEPFDRNNLSIRRGTLTALIATAKAGKTWFLIHCGREALNRRWRVVHITLELDEIPVLLRYYQALLVIPRRSSEIMLTQLVVRGDRLDGIDKVPSNFDFTLDPAGNFDVRKELTTHLIPMGKKLERLKIKRFPMRTLTMDKLRAYLDMLDDDGFTPDLLIVDYPKIMKVDTDNYRISLGHIVEDLRGLCAERNVAGVMVHQSSRVGDRAGRVEAAHAAEDWSIIATVDNALTFSRTDSERALGLGRMFLDRARDEKDGYNVLITQNYDLGQFCTSAFELPDNYQKYLDEFGAAAPPDGDM